MKEVDGERLQGGMRVEKWIEERKEHPRHRGEEIIRGRDGKESEDKRRSKIEVYEVRSAVREKRRKGENGMAKER